MRQPRSGYRQSKRYSSKDIPPRQEIELILQENSVEYDPEMTREELWNIWVTYYHARHQLISSVSLNNEAGQRVIEKINKNYCNSNMKKCSNI